MLVLVEPSFLGVSSALSRKLAFGLRVKKTVAIGLAASIGCNYWARFIPKRILYIVSLGNALYSFATSYW